MRAFNYLSIPAVLLLGCGQPGSNADPVVLPVGNDAGIAGATTSALTSSCGFDWGTITYRNTVTEIIDDRCLNCHAPAYEDRASEGMYAATPHGLSWAEWSDVFDNLALICWAATDVSGGIPYMPANQTEEPLSELELAQFTTWCSCAADGDLSDCDETTLQGSELPQVATSVTSTTIAAGGVVTINYEATDADDSKLQVAFYFDDTRSGFDGTELGCDTIAISGGNGSSSYDYTADGSLGAGDYYVYVCVGDGETAYCDYGSGIVTVSDETCDGAAATTYYPDEDGDGYGVASGAAQVGCAATTGYATSYGDCDDEAATTSPVAGETCDSIDNNCDGAVDEGVTTTYYRDADGDGYGDVSSTSDACSAPSGYVTDSTDCDDTSLLTRPSGTETCDRADNDCDGVADEGIGTTHYRDADGDGYGARAPTQIQCFPSAGWVLNRNDCSDSNASYWSYRTYYRDADGDGYTASSPRILCVPTAADRTTATAVDCNDSNASVSPGARESRSATGTCSDGIDNDCDRLVDGRDLACLTIATAPISL